MSSTSLRGSVAVVSGATSDIGRAISLELAAAGARLCLLARDVSTIELVAQQVREVSDDVLVYPVDLTDEDSILAATTRLSSELGRVDVLVHSAGRFAMASHDRAPVTELDLQYRTNVRGPYLLTQALLPALRFAKGQIAFLNSTVGLEARPLVGQYASTHHALRAIADALRAEINADGVRVLSIYLGRTATARQARIFQLEGRPYAPELLMQPGDVAEMIRATLQLPRTAEVTEIRMRPLIKSY